MREQLARIWKFLKLPKDAQLLIMRVYQDQFLVGVTGIIFNKKEEVLLFKHTYRQNAWSLPGGYLKAKEHPKEGLEREIREESGLVVSVGEQLKTRTDRESARLDMCYTGTFISGMFSPSHEVSEGGFFPFERLPEIPKNQLFLIEAAIAERRLPRAKETKGEEPVGKRATIVTKIRSLFAD